MRPLFRTAAAGRVADRPAVEPLFQPVEEIGQDRRDHACLTHQRLGLEALDIGEGEMLFGRVEQTAVGTVKRVGAERGAKRVRLEQQGEAGQCPFLGRRGREAAQRGPDRVLDLGRDNNLLVREQRTDPLRCPAPFGGAVGSRPGFIG